MARPGRRCSPHVRSWMRSNRCSCRRWLDKPPGCRDFSSGTWWIYERVSAAGYPGVLWELPSSWPALQSRRTVRRSRSRCVGRPDRPPVVLTRGLPTLFRAKTWDHTRDTHDLRMERRPGRRGSCGRESLCHPAARRRSAGVGWCPWTDVTLGN